eukprot:6204491-Pleurochrysis_carterae.AAC.3
MSYLRSLRSSTFLANISYMCVTINLCTVRTFRKLPLSLGFAWQLVRMKHNAKYWVFISNEASAFCAWLDGGCTCCEVNIFESYMGKRQIIRIEIPGVMDLYKRRDCFGCFDVTLHAHLLTPGFNSSSCLTWPATSISNSAASKWQIVLSYLPVLSLTYLQACGA